MNNNDPIRYFLYARKSSESEDRQMASIEDQINVMKQFAKERRIVIHDVIHESKSAKAPGREGFAELLSRLRNGEAQGVLTWKPNRLARNSVDGGNIIWMLQQGIIKHLQTYSSSYHPSDNVLMLYMEFGMANQYSNDLGVDVKRGMLAKANRGWFPATRLPLGYAHNAGYRMGIDPEIIPKEPDFSFLRTLWKKLIKGKHSMAKLYEEAKLHNLSSGKGGSISRSTFYRIFTNPFYYGAFYWKDREGRMTQFKGQHTPMVTYKEFQRAQDILHAKAPVPPNASYLFPYVGLFRCGECACSISAEQKRQTICTNCKKKFSIKTATSCPACGLKIANMDSPKVLTYTYYRCSKSKGKESCNQKYLRDTELDEQILGLAKKIALPPRIIAFFRKIISQEEPRGVSFEDITMAEQTKKKIAVLQRRKERFIEMRADREINREEFQNHTEKITSQIAELQSSLQDFTQADEAWKEEFSTILDLAEIALWVLEKGTLDEKIALIKGFASNLIIRDKTLLKPTDSLLLALRSMVEEVVPLKPILEPKKMAQPSPYFHHFTLSDEMRLTLLAEWDKLRTWWTVYRRHLENQSINKRDTYSKSA